MLTPEGVGIEQEIYEDSYGFDVWERSQSSRCFVTMLDAVSWHAITDELPPTEPTTAERYQAEGIPWFDYYDADQKTDDLDPALSRQPSGCVPHIGEWNGVKKRK